MSRDGARASVAVVTLGCKANHYDSAVLRDRLRDAGFEVVRESETADAYLVNSCTVTQRSDFQARQMARRCKRRNPEARVLLVGCYAQTQPEACAAAEGVDLVIGNQARHRIPQLLGDLLQGRVSPALPSGAAIADFGDRVPDFERARPYLKIQDGCDDRCAYCAVPDARGPSRSLPPEPVLERIAELGRRGYREVVLSGVHLGRYGRDLSPPTDLASLIEAIEATGACQRVRLSSLEPQAIDADLLEALLRSQILCRHLHLPLQSGDDDVLRKMGRPYRAARFVEVVRTVLAIWPDAAIGADVIVGLPGEDEAAFARTEALVGELPLAYLHVFPFSPRPGTRAGDLPDRPPQRVASERAGRMRELSVALRARFREQALGREHEVLVETEVRGEAGMLRGTSRNYVPFRFEGEASLINELVPVHAESLFDDHVQGRLVG